MKNATQRRQGGWVVTCAGLWGRLRAVREWGAGAKSAARATFLFREFRQVIDNAAWLTRKRRFRGKLDDARRARKLGVFFINLPEAASQQPLTGFARSSSVKVSNLTRSVLSCSFALYRHAIVPAQQLFEDAPPEIRLFPGRSLVSLGSGGRRGGLQA